MSGPKLFDGKLDNANILSLEVQDAITILRRELFFSDTSNAIFPDPDLLQPFNRLTSGFTNAIQLDVLIQTLSPITELLSGINQSTLEKVIKDGINLLLSQIKIITEAAQQKKLIISPGMRIGVES